MFEINIFKSDTTEEIKDGVSKRSAYLSFFSSFIIFCIMASLFFSLFVFGGVFAPIFIVFYMYYLIYKKIQCFNKDALDIEDKSCDNFLDSII